MVWSFISFSQQSEWEFYKDIDGVKFEIRTIEYLVMNYLHSEFQTRMIILFYVLEGGSMDRWNL